MILDLETSMNREKMSSILIRFKNITNRKKMFLFQCVMRANGWVVRPLSVGLGLVFRTRCNNFKTIKGGPF